MRKYIGSSMTSQKTKKRKKSSAHEDAHHAGLEQQEEREVALHALVDAPRREDAEEAEQRRQQHHRDADAVDADEVLDVEAGIHGTPARRTGSRSCVRSKLTNSQIASSSGGTVRGDRHLLDQRVRARAAGRAITAAPSSGMKVMQSGETCCVHRRRAPSSARTPQRSARSDQHRRADRRR